MDPESNRSHGADSGIDSGSGTAHCRRQYDVEGHDRVPRSPQEPAHAVERGGTRCAVGSVMAPAVASRPGTHQAARRTPTSTLSLPLGLLHERSLLVRVFNSIWTDQGGSGAHRKPVPVGWWARPALWLQGVVAEEGTSRWTRALCGRGHIYYVGYSFMCR